MRKLFNTLQAWFRAKYMIAVIIPEYKGIHWTFSYLEAHFWLNEYPLNVSHIWHHPESPVIVNFLVCR